MKNIRTLVGIALFAMTSVTTSVASAHDHRSGHDGQHAKSHGPLGMVMRGAMDPAPHLAELKGVLNLTTEQMPSWNAFEETSLRLAAKRKALVETARANNTPKTEMREQMRAFREGNKAEMQSVRTALFSSLSDTQKAAVKEHFKAKFRTMHEQHRGGQRG